MYQWYYMQTPRCAWRHTGWQTPVVTLGHISRLQSTGGHGRAGSLSVVAPPVGGYAGLGFGGAGVGCGVCTRESCSDTTGIMSRLL